MGSGCGRRWGLKFLELRGSGTSRESLGPDLLEPNFQEREPGEKVSAWRARQKLRGVPRQQGSPDCWLETCSWEFYGNLWEVVG